MKHTSSWRLPQPSPPIWHSGSGEPLGNPKSAAKMEIPDHQNGTDAAQEEYRCEDINGADFWSWQRC
jgi:hypothetical protein